MKPAFILILLTIIVVLGVLVFKYVLPVFPGLQKVSSGGGGGIFKSMDQGETWVQLAAKKEGDRTKIKISELKIYDIEINPQDSNILFAGTASKGFIKSFDSGNSWQGLSRGALGADSPVLDVVLNSHNPRSIYLASYFGSLGRILKSEDMGESFKEVYVAHADKVMISQIKVNNYNSSIIFASTSDGLFLESRDFGKSWQIIKKFEKPIQKFIINRKDTREIYVILGKEGGLFRTSDKGLTWQDLQPNLEKLYSKYKLGDIREVAIDILSPNLIYVGAGPRIFRSFDRGDNFEEITSFIAGGEYEISTIAIDFSDSSKIYVAGHSQIYKSVDGGGQWMVKKLNTQKNIQVFKIDPNNSSTIYVGLGQ